MQAFVSFLVIVVFALVLVAWLMAINLFIKAAQEKGYYKDGAGVLWFIGIFATPIVVGIYTSALPDKRSREAMSNAGGTAVGAAVQDELPSI